MSESLGFVDRGGQPGRGPRGQSAGNAHSRLDAIRTPADRNRFAGGKPESDRTGLVLRGFVERVGDPAPLVAADGTKYLGEVLTVEAIEAMARTVGYGTPVTIAIPAYWSEAQATALREEPSPSRT